LITKQKETKSTIAKFNYDEYTRPLPHIQPLSDQNLYDLLNQIDRYTINTAKDWAEQNEIRKIKMAYNTEYSAVYSSYAKTAYTKR